MIEDVYGAIPGYLHLLGQQYSKPFEREYRRDACECAEGEVNQGKGHHKRKREDRYLMFREHRLKPDGKHESEDNSENEQDQKGGIDVKLVQHADTDKNGIEPVQARFNFPFGETKQVCQQVCQHHGSEAPGSNAYIEHAQEKQQYPVCPVLSKEDLGITMDDAVQV